jgi:hypothetical protein
VQESEEVKNQLALLTTHRDTLAILLRQQAVLGSAYAPPSILHGIYQSRAEIKRIKKVLRSWGYDLEDEPNDDEPSVTSISSVNTGLTPSVQGDQVVLSHSQTIGGNAQVGVAVSGDIHGNINITDYTNNFNNPNRERLEKIEKCIRLADNYIKSNSQIDNLDPIEDMEEALRNLQIAKRSLIEKKQERMMSKIKQAYDIASSIKDTSKSEIIEDLVTLLKSLLERR